MPIVSHDSLYLLPKIGQTGSCCPSNGGNQLYQIELTMSLFIIPLQFYLFVTLNLFLSNMVFFVKEYK